MPYSGMLYKDVGRTCFFPLPSTRVGFLIDEYAVNIEYASRFCRYLFWTTLFYLLFDNLVVASFPTVSSVLKIVSEI